MGERVLPFLASLHEPEIAGPAALDHPQRLYLNCARVLLLSGALLVIPTVGNPGAETVSAFLGFLLFLLGVFLVMLSPVANQLPDAARVGAAVANAILNYFALDPHMPAGLLQRALPFLASLHEPEIAGPAALDHPQRIYLNSARVLLLSGVLLVIPTVGNPGADTVSAFLSFLIFLLGVFLVMLSPVANQLRVAARVGAAVGNAILNYFALDPHMPAGLLQRALALADRGRAARRVRLLIVNSGILLMSTAASVVIYVAANPSAVDDPAYALVAFLLFLLGGWLALLALVADQFPRAARIGVAIARALQDYLFGGN